MQPELEAVLQPYGAARVSACDLRAAGVLSGAWLVGAALAHRLLLAAAEKDWAQVQARTCRAQRQRRRCAVGWIVWVVGCGSRRRWGGAVEARKGGTTRCRRCCSRMLELTQPTRMGTTRQRDHRSRFRGRESLRGRGAMVADDDAAWSGFGAVSRADGIRGMGMGTAACRWWSG